MKRAIVLAILVLGLALPSANVKAHSTYCGHGTYYNWDNTNRYVFHHSDNFGAEHWHFYKHQLWTGNSYFTIHGYWRQC